MLVHKAYKYRIYPNPEQRQLIHQMFGCCRFVFKHFLVKWNETYAATGKGLSYNTCATQLPALKQQFEWLKSVDSIALQSAVRNVADSFERFFKKQNQAPRFKSRKHPVQSYTTKYTNDNIAIDGNDLNFRSLGGFALPTPERVKVAFFLLPCGGMRQASILYPSSAKWK
ncbi:hypothetical protein PUR_27780 [Paenibacillus sp. URB8-2]|nr:hypothetical protein PUR_27780 [Paenibacillus sp. URB8-2]